MYHTRTLQHQYLSDLIQQQKPLHVYLKDGRRLKGFLMGMTDEAIFFREETTEIYYKKMIHGIFPVIEANS
jgi:sRNA-binding regulator protein Hfq